MPDIAHNPSPRRKIWRRLGSLAVVGVVAAASAAGGAAWATGGIGGAFSDVPPSNPFYDDIAWMDETGLSTGYVDGTFRPQEVVTRQTMSAFLHRDREQYEWIEVTPAAFTNQQQVVLTAVCPDGKAVFNGGGFTNLPTEIPLTESYPWSPTPGVPLDRWTFIWRSPTNVSGQAFGYILCGPTV